MRLLSTFLFLMAVLGMTTSSFGDELKQGSQAPAFELKGSDGKSYKLADFKGKQVVVLAWFPKAFTGG